MAIKVAKQSHLSKHVLPWFRALSKSVHKKDLYKAACHPLHFELLAVCLVGFGQYLKAENS